jgi:hypothetical protein
MVCRQRPVARILNARGRRPAVRHPERIDSWPQNHEPVNFSEFEIARERVLDPNRSHLARTV